MDKRGCELDTDKDGIVDSVDQCAASPMGTAVTELGCEVDSDSDGVVDSQDQCAETASGVAVGVDGCELDSDQDGVVDSIDLCLSAPMVVVDAQGCEVDTDGDGLIDSKDACPESPTGIKVAEDGCEIPLDSDTDGVEDAIDICPGSKASDNIDSLGCDADENIILGGIRFKTNSNELTTASALVLSEIAERLAYHTELKLMIAGHTDHLGHPDHNLKLSTERAETVRVFLVDRGISADNLSVEGYGHTQPITDNSTVAKRYINRRVEIIRN